MLVASFLVLTALALTSGPAAPQQTKAANQPPALSYVVPPTRSVLGKSYAQWSAEWWKWALLQCSLPCDPSYNVAQGQAGNVWFLSGTFGSCVRQVRIPAGKWLFFPMANAEASSLGPPPYFGCTPAEQAAAARATANYIRQPFVEVDGIALPEPERYRFVSPQFSMTLPVPNCLGIPAGTISICPYVPPPLPMQLTAVSDGYWAMVEPLPVGSHLVRFGGKFRVGGIWVGGIDMTYSITVF